MRFFEKSDKRSNAIAIKNIKNKGYVEKARVTGVTKCNTHAIVNIRADGAMFKINVQLDKVNDVYEDPKSFIEELV